MSLPPNVVVAVRRMAEMVTVCCGGLFLVASLNWVRCGIGVGEDAHDPPADTVPGGCGAVRTANIVVVRRLASRI